MSKVYEKLKKIRNASTVKLKPCKRLKTHLTLADGSQVPLKLRDYQAQMVFHLLMRKRFVVGDATGLGKCLIKCSVVPTNYGLVPIGDMHDWSEMEPETFEPIDRDWRVLVGGESLPVKNFYYGGVKPTIKVSTRYGFELEGSRVHPLLVWRDGEHQWVELRDLREGDHVCVERREVEFPLREPELRAPGEQAAHARVYELPERLSPQSVPDCVMRGTRESNVAFLRAAFEAEACVLSSGGVEFSSASERFARQLQIMLTRFGIICNRSRKTVKGYEDNTYWRLTLFGHDARLFRDQIGFISARKTEALDAALDRPTNANHDVVPDCKPLVEALRARLEEAVSQRGANADRKGSGLKQFGRSFVSTLDNIRNRGRNPTYRFLNELLDAAAQSGLGGCAEYEAVSDLTSRHYFYDPVVGLEEGEAEVFDIEVDDSRHWFVSNGLVNHNTLECIAAQCYLWEKKPELRPIIVTTTSAMYQWAGEFDKFTTGVSCHLAEGSPDKRLATYEEYVETWDPEHPSVLILNYDRMRIDNRKIRKLIEDIPYVIYFDEVTAVKNPASATHIAAARLSHEANRAYGITATLIKNNLMEGFGIYKVILPGLFSTKKNFMYNYCITRMQPIGRGRKVPVVVGHSRDQISLFREKIDPYYLGRPKHEVAKELPALTVKELNVDLSKSQWKYYSQALEGLLEVNLSHEMVSAESLIDPEGDDDEVETSHLTQLIYCQEIVDDLYLIGNEGDSSKVKILLDLLDSELADEKVIIFTRFRRMVDRLQDILSERGYEIGIAKQGGSWEPRTDIEKGLVRVTGSEDSEQRNAGQRAFTQTENTNIIFLTMAGAEAINLQTARVMVFFDLPWSAGDYLQLVGRMVRIGSKHPSVYAIHLLSQGPFGEKTIDHHVSKTLDKKMGFIEGALGKRLVEGSDDGGIIFEGSETQNLYEALIASARETQGDTT